MDNFRELLARAKDNDKEARDYLVESNLNLVRSIANRYKVRGATEEDLFQIGVIGLIKAIDGFNLDYDVKFSTYAVPVISGEIKKFFRDDGMLKVSRSIKENGVKVRRASEEFEQKNGRPPTILEVKEMTRLEYDEIMLALEAQDEIGSIFDDDEGWLQSGNDDKEQILDRMVLGQLMQELSDVERKVIIMRYFEEITQNEVAKRLNMTQVQVSRMEKRILMAMRMSALN